MTIFKSKFQGVRRFAASQNRFQKFTHTPKHPRNTPFKPFMAIHITVVILVLDRDVFNSTLATLCFAGLSIRVVQMAKFLKITYVTGFSHAF